MKQALIILFFFFAGVTCFAADTIIVHKDPRLDIFTKKQAEVNKRTSGMTSSGLYRGYRLQVLSTRSREDAFKLKTQLLKMFPSQESYVVFQSPYFKVRIGNFIRKTDAESFKSELSKYTQNAYIVEDAIEYTPPKDEDSTLSN